MTAKRRKKRKRRGKKFPLLSDIANGKSPVAVDIAVTAEHIMSVGKWNNEEFNLQESFDRNSIYIGET